MKKEKYTEKNIYRKIGLFTRKVHWFDFDENLWAEIKEYFKEIMKGKEDSISKADVGAASEITCEFEHVLLSVKEWNGFEDRLAEAWWEFYDIMSDQSPREIDDVWDEIDKPKD